MINSLKKERPHPPFRGLGGAFVETFYPFASLVEKQFGINPVVILAQAALESGWGESVLSREAFNFFGLAAYGSPNEFWEGAFIELSEDSPRFRRYESLEQGFPDYGRLLATNYPGLVKLSYRPEAFAQQVAFGTTLSGIPPNPLKGGRGQCCGLPEGCRLYVRDMMRIVEFINVHCKCL